MTGRKAFLIFAGLGVLLAGFMIFRSLNDNLTYYLFPNEALAERQDFPDGRPFRLAGTVVAGSLVTEGGDSTFEVTDGGTTIPVRLTSTPPQLFGEESMVLLTGSWEENVFVANDAIIRHDENYATPSSGNFEETG